MPLPKSRQLYRSLALLLLMGLLAVGPVAAVTNQNQLLRHQVAKLEPPPPIVEEGFGIAVAISGDTAVVGAPYAEDYGFESGAAYIFQYEPASADWVQVARITASDAGPAHWFGYSLAIHNDTVVVGAPVSLPGGAAYVFYRDRGGPNAWGEVVRVSGVNTSWNDFFGFSVALDGDTLVVGAYAGGDYDGQAYVFSRNQGGPDAWRQVAELVGSDVQPYDYFGSAVAVSGDTAVVGACGTGDGTTGAAYVFQRDQGGPDAWGQVTQLQLADGMPEDWFGLPVAIHGDIAAVSAQGRNLDGAVYLFDRNQGGAGGWGQVAEITPGEPGTAFAVSLDIVSDTLAVGALAREPGGAVYVFERYQGGTDVWGQVACLVAQDPQPDAALGRWVSLADDHLVAGAPGDGLSGAAYIFSLPNVPPSKVVISGTTDPVYEGQPLLLTGGFSDLDLDDSFTVTVDWGDGGSSLADVGGYQPTYTFTASYTYTEGPATYPITVTVVDEQEASAWATSTIVVSNVAPVLAPLPDEEVAAGTPLTLTASFADPGVLDSHIAVVYWTPAISWTAALSAGVTAFTTTHTYTGAGHYTVSVVIADDDGGEDTGTFGVSVYKDEYAIFLPLVIR